MPAIIHVLPLWTKNPPGKAVSTIAKHSWLSPFVVGPCKLYDGHISQNMENGWQFAKVYREFVTRKIGMLMPSWIVSSDYMKWAKKGWADYRAHRYPMGKGALPLFSLWDGEQLGYIQARKKIYVPLYAKAVQKTQAWKKLKSIYKNVPELTLLDYDAHDHVAQGQTLSDVLNDPKRKMGHAFVLAMLLTKDEALEQCDL